MSSFHENIQVQSIKFYPTLFWKNILAHMLECLQEKQLFKFQHLFLELILVRDSEMSLYNHNHMNCTGPTNILSFPHEEDEISNDKKNHTHNKPEKKQSFASPFAAPPNPFLNEKNVAQKIKLYYAPTLVHWYLALIH